MRGIRQALRVLRPRRFCASSYRLLLLGYFRELHLKNLDLRLELTARPSAHTLVRPSQIAPSSNAIPPVGSGLDDDQVYTILRSQVVGVAAQLLNVADGLCDERGLGGSIDDKPVALPVGDDQSAGVGPRNLDTIRRRDHVDPHVEKIHLDRRGVRTGLDERLCGIQSTFLGLAR